MCSSELGDGWKPTVLETESENDFIRAGQRGLSDAGDYFIAGSAYPEHTGSFKFVFPGCDDDPFDGIVIICDEPPVYSPSQSGNTSRILVGLTL